MHGVGLDLANTPTLLAVVKHLVSLHGGTVAARNDGIGKGSAFTVRLPAIDKSSGSYRLSFPD
jgi:signal transduction histidine kinase